MGSRGGSETLQDCESFEEAEQSEGSRGGSETLQDCGNFEEAEQSEGSRVKKGVKPNVSDKERDADT